MTPAAGEQARQALAQAEAAVARGDDQAAIAAYGLATQADPALAAAWFGLGNQRMRLGDLRAAIEAFTRVVEIGPPSAGALYNLGNALGAANDLERAEAAYRRAIDVDPTYARAYNNLADVHRRRGDYRDAEANFREAIRLDPTYELAYHGLGDTLTRLRRGAAAAAVLAGLVRHRPDNAQAMHSLAMALHSAGDTERAAAVLDRAIGLRDLPGWRVERALLLPIILDSIGHRDQWRRRYARSIDALAADERPLPPAALPGPPFRLCYQGLDDRPLQEALARAMRRRFPVLNFTAPHVGGLRPPGPFRVGLLSATLRTHTVGRLMGTLIGDLRGPGIELTLFQSGRIDQQAGEIAATADRSIRLAGPLPERQRAVAAAQLDFLLYPEIGMDQVTWQLAFARLAPLQAVTWGHPVTTGIDTIDAYLSSRDHEPEDGDDHYSERLVRLDGMPMIHHRPPAAAPFDRARHGIAADAPLLACPQSPFKIHPDADALFAAALRAAPRALLVIPHWVEPDWVDRIHRRFAKAHPDVEARLIHPKRLEHGEYLGLVADCVALLDPPHFTGGQTTLEAFSLGTPVVTLPGRFMRGRLTYGFYRRLGIEDAIARDEADYARIVGRLVDDRPWRDALAARIRTATEARLIDDRTGADALRAYVRGLAGLA